MYALRVPHNRVEIDLILKGIKTFQLAIVLEISSSGRNRPDSQRD